MTSFVQGTTQEQTILVMSSWSHTGSGGAEIATQSV